MPVGLKPTPLWSKGREALGWSLPTHFLSRDVNRPRPRLQTRESPARTVCPSAQGVPSRSCRHPSLPQTFPGTGGTEPGKAGRGPSWFGCRSVICLTSEVGRTLQVRGRCFRFLAVPWECSTRWAQSPATSGGRHSPGSGRPVIVVAITSGHVSFLGHLLAGGRLSSSLPPLPRISLSI